MNKIFNYLKFISVFLIIELMITFIISLLNLIGLNSGIGTIIILICNIILFFALNFFILLMFLIKIILFENTFKISTLIYYLILFITSIFGGMFGVNKKSEE